MLERPVGLYRLRLGVAAAQMSVPRLSVWPTLPPRIYARGAPEPLPFPLADDRCRLYPRGRHALYCGVRALGLGPGDEALVPAYHHGSEVQALIEAGVTPRFYESGERLEPDQETLESMLGPKVRALHLTHFMGFPQDSARWRAWCDVHDLVLLEDAAQAWLSSSGGVPAGSVGDLGIFCLYKTVGVPEGAVLLCDPPPAPPAPDRRLGIYEVARRHGAWLAERSAPVRSLTDAFERRAEFDPVAEVALGEVGAGAWRVTPWLLSRVCQPGIAARRRANYRFLLDFLADQVPAPFDQVPDGASPFAFPIEVDEKSRLLERLATAGVGALDFWSLPHPACQAGSFPDAERRRRRTVGLPVHQELRPAELERVVAAMRPRPGRARDRGLRGELLDGVDAESDRWSELAEASDSIFATSEWLSTWWRHFGAGEQRVLGCRRAAGELVAVVPLYRYRTGPLRTLRFIGHGPSDELGPVCRPRDRAAVARALHRALEDGVVGGWDVLLAERLPAQHGWGALLGGAVLGTESSPVVRGGRSFEDLLASRSSNFRQQVRRRERKLLRDHDLRYRLAADPDRLDEDLDRLFALHAARWRAGESDAFTPERQAFHREFAAVALARGWCRLWFAEIGGRAVAALYGFRFAGSELYYQSGRDPDWDDSAVGFVLLCHAIRSALDDGLHEYRLLRGDEPYKRRFSDHDPGLETVLVGRGGVRAAAAATAGALAEHARTRRWLARLAQVRSG